MGTSWKRRFAANVREFEGYPIGKTIKYLVEPRSWLVGDHYCHNWRGGVLFGGHDALRVLWSTCRPGSLA